MMNSSQNIHPEIQKLNDLGHACLGDLGGLFYCLEKVSADPTAVLALSRIGRYLAEDWANSMFDPATAAGMEVAHA